MQLYKTLHIGTSHINFCEDYLLEATIGEHKKLFAVLDGCSMGNESYFASALSGKILKKIAIEEDFLMWKQEADKCTNEDMLRRILCKLFKEYKSIAHQLLLNKKDLLATLVICLYDTQLEEGDIMVVGDGVVCVDGKITEFDQNNKPDYLGYHLDENFEDWYKKQTQRIKIKNAKDIGIATDGILTFESIRIHSIDEETDEMDPVAFLLIDLMFSEQEQMLFRKMVLLEKEYGLKPIDDVAVVRVVF